MRDRVERGEATFSNVLSVFPLPTIGRGPQRTCALGSAFSKVLSTVTLYSKFTRALTFENFAQLQEGSRATLLCCLDTNAKEEVCSAARRPQPAGAGALSPARTIFLPTLC